MTTQLITNLRLQNSKFVSENAGKKMLGSRTKPKLRKEAFGIIPAYEFEISHLDGRLSNERG
jgi:hypothetical protein